MMVNEIMQHPVIMGGIGAQFLVEVVATFPDMVLADDKHF
jgi:hypothetical protein